MDPIKQGAYLFWTAKISIEDPSKSGPIQYELRDHIMKQDNNYFFNLMDNILRDFRSDSIEKLEIDSPRFKDSFFRYIYLIASNNVRTTKKQEIIVPTVDDSTFILLQDLLERLRYSGYLKSGPVVEMVMRVQRINTDLFKEIDPKWAAIAEEKNRRRAAAEAEEEQRQRKAITAREEAARRLIAEEEERRKSAVAFRSKAAGANAARANAEQIRETAVKAQAEAALVGNRWKLAIVKDMDPEEKRHFAVALLHKQNPASPVYPFYGEIDKIEAIDEYIEQLRNELSPRVAPRESPANVGNPFNRITNSMLGGTRKQKKRRSSKRKTH